MCKWAVSCVFIFGFFLQVSAAPPPPPPPTPPPNTTIVIHELSGADSAQLGTNTTTLKCDYDFDGDTGVGITWFYNFTIPIVLLVPDHHHEPKLRESFSNLIEVTNNTIHFKEITKNLTGNYTCKVSSIEGEKEWTVVMVAYQPAKSVEFFVEETSKTLICAAYELYPLPTITVSGSYVSGSNESITLEPANDDDILKDEDDFYNVTRVFKLDKDALKGSVDFTCNVFIPDTSYNETKDVRIEIAGNESSTEYPDYLDSTTETSINSTMIISTQSTIKGDFAVVSSAPSKWLMMVAAFAVVGSKL